MRRLKEFTGALFIRVQRVLVPAMLFFVYYFVLGPMALAARLFGLLPKSVPLPGTFWCRTRRSGTGVREAAEQS